MCGHLCELLVLGVVGLYIGLCAGCAREKVPDLRAARVAVHPLIHNSVDPTIAFPEIFPLQVAVYWTKPPEDDILSIIHSLRAMGIPFFVTRDLQAALKHRLVIIYPSVEAHTFTENQASDLREHIRNGGSVFGVNIFDDALRDIFGFSGFTASRKRYQVTFVPGSDVITRYLNRPEELQVPLGDRKYAEIFWSNGYTADPETKVLARFEDGTAALLQKRLGSGSAYLCGVSYHDVVLRSQINRDYDAERHYANAFEPGADVWMLLIRAWYEANEPDAVRSGTIPDGKDSVLLLSHDVDWENSFAPAVEFARMEKAHNASSTFFIQTKYVSDYNSNAFFFDTDLVYLKMLPVFGDSIGSHSIIHSRGFNRFELGTGRESFATYRPHGTGFDTASGATVFGEVVVSKQLLDGELQGQKTTFFRAGHLRVPPSLPEALERSGYEFDSSFTADDVLTNFPYALPLGLGFTEDSTLYEFPVTFEDEESPALPERIDRALDVIRANAENDAISVILIHSNEANAKLRAEETLLGRLPDGVTASDMLSYARFWRSRDKLHWTIESGGSEGIVLNLHAQEAIHGLTFEFRREVASAKEGAKLLPDRHRIILPDLSSGEDLSVPISYTH